MDCLKAICCCWLESSSGIELHELNLQNDLVLHGSAISRQHPMKINCSSSVNADAYAIGPKHIAVADGVSSVELEGCNPGRLPSELLRRCVVLADLRRRNKIQFDAESQDLFSSEDLYFSESEFPKHILARACAECEELGSTTCCMAILEAARIRAVNIGDSQMILLRRSAIPPRDVHQRLPSISSSKSQQLTTAPNTSSSSSLCSSISDGGGYKIVSRTFTQQHFFNCPYQLTRMPDVDCSFYEVMKRTAIVACVSTHEVEAGDILIFGSDGVFDNLFDDEICAILDETCWATAAHTPFNIPRIAPSVVADRIVEEALEAAFPPGLSSSYHSSTRFRKPGRPTPFSASARAELGRPLDGGKPDDTTAVVAFVKPRKMQSAAAESLIYASSNSKATAAHTENLDGSPRRDSRTSISPRPSGASTRYSPRASGVSTSFSPRMMPPLRGSTFEANDAQAYEKAKGETASSYIRRRSSSAENPRNIKS